MAVDKTVNHDSGGEPAEDHTTGCQQPDGPDLRGDEEPEAEAGEQRRCHRVGRS